MEDDLSTTAEREALRAEMRLYARILAWRDLRKLEAGRIEEDDLSRRVTARLRAAQRIWNSWRGYDDIPF